VRISSKELELSASLVDSFAGEFDAADFSDEYQAELRTLIEAKLEKGDALDTSETFGDRDEDSGGGEVIDLMAALRASVEKSRAARGEKSGSDASGKASSKSAASSSNGSKGSNGSSGGAAKKKATATSAAEKKPAAKKKTAKAS
jgi:DNA end-binding protein Ku